ncbi:MAG: abortive infection system antitoxin AbiGi family protein [Candidatus Dadabacteria bacterium]|nr:abortive infection system antitoxin AbiGi family protein [Candidatus Dadabacteria bacterium]
MLRSNFLSYWTGRDIEKRVYKLNKKLRLSYLDRLCSILESGIWMNVVEERLTIRFDDKNKIHFKMNIPMVCFTELRLSQSRNHYTKYGLLGFVVDREFIITRHGGPVFYVQSDADESIARNLFGMLPWLQKQFDQKIDGAEDTLNNIHVSLSYVKSMSSPGKKDLANLNENEWRIAHTFNRQAEGYIVETGLTRPKYKIPIEPSDLKMLVLPDARFRDLITQDDRVEKLFNNKFPPMLTIKEIGEI